MCIACSSVKPYLVVATSGGGWYPDGDAACTDTIRWKLVSLAPCRPGGEICYNACYRIYVFCDMYYYILGCGCGSGYQNCSLVPIGPMAESCHCQNLMLTLTLILILTRIVTHANTMYDQ